MIRVKIMDKIKSDTDSFVAEPRESQNITSEKIKAMLPKGSRANIGEAVVRMANSMGSDVDLPQTLMEEAFLGNLHQMSKIKNIGTIDIINATKFCNLTRNYDNKKSWAMTFPDKYDKLIAEKRQVDSHVSMYKTSKLVQAIDEEMLIPVHLQYSPYFHASVKELYKVGVLGQGGTNAEGEEMTVTPLVKVQALKELATLTKQPEKAKIDITVNQGEEAMAAQNTMNEQLAKISGQMEKAMANGESIEDVQVMNIGIEYKGNEDE